MLTTRDVNEIADSPAGSVPKPLSIQSPAEAGAAPTQSKPAVSPQTLSYATVNRGTVKFDEVKK